MGIFLKRRFVKDRLLVLILVIMEWDGNTHDFDIVLVEELVLILVIMEWDGNEMVEHQMCFTCVLILVIMEWDGNIEEKCNAFLVLGLNPYYNGMRWECHCRGHPGLARRLNPCYNGMRWEYPTKHSFEEFKRCLNPCYNGMRWEYANAVLDSITVSGLNPCYNGMRWE